MSSGSTRIVLPADLLQEIDELVGIGARAEFITSLARREVHRLRLLRFLGEKPSGWDLEKHPELKHGTARRSG
jgi:metal-responsive CopG/Arc/MetJ family transcriptional regulator